MTQTYGQPGMPTGVSRPTCETDDFASTLLYELAPPLQRYVRKLLPGDLHRAEDIVQEALLRAWQHREYLLKGPSPRPWIFRVAHNLSIDWYRHQSARPPEISGDVAQDSDYIAADQMQIVLDRKVLVDVMQDLPLPQKEILLYLYYLGLKQVEVANILGIAQGTVKSRAHYALAELRLVMEERGLVRYK